MKLTELCVYILQVKQHAKKATCFGPLL